MQVGISKYTTSAVALLGEYFKFSHLSAGASLGSGAQRRAEEPCNIQMRMKAWAYIEVSTLAVPWRIMAAKPFLLTLLLPAPKCYGLLDACPPVPCTTRTRTCRSGLLLLATCHPVPSFVNVRTCI